MNQQAIEAAEKYIVSDDPTEQGMFESGFLAGAKWREEQMPEDEAIIKFVDDMNCNGSSVISFIYELPALKQLITFIKTGE